MCTQPENLYLFLIPGNHVSPPHLWFGMCAAQFYLSRQSFEGPPSTSPSPLQAENWLHGLPSIKQTDLLQ